MVNLACRQTHGHRAMCGSEAGWAEPSLKRFLNSSPQVQIVKEHVVCLTDLGDSLLAKNLADLTEAAEDGFCLSSQPKSLKIIFENIPLNPWNQFLELFSKIWSKSKVVSLNFAQKRGKLKFFTFFKQQNIFSVPLDVAQKLWKFKISRFLWKLGFLLIFRQKRLPIFG